MLIGTGDVRSYLGLDPEDKKPNAKISSLINSIQGFAENYCNRPFEAKLYKTDPQYCYFDGTGYGVMFLPVYPVWYVNEVAIDADRVFGSATLTATDDIILYETAGKIVGDAGNFTKGRRNVRLEYYAGYGAGTHPTHDGQGFVQFAVPYDLKQTIIEMVIKAINEGITGIHTIAGVEENKLVQMLNSNSVWKATLDIYKRWDINAASGYYL
jgi:hypothetical protein